MKLKFTFLTILVGYFLFSQNNSNSFQRNSSPFSFVENKGQIYDQNYKANPEVLYLLNMPGLNVQLKKNGYSYDVYERDIIKKQPSESSLIPSKINDIEQEEFNLKLHRIDFEFLNTNPYFTRLELGNTQGVRNYYLEHIPNGVFGVNSYQKIVYENFYNHIDLEFVSTNDSVKPFEYNFILHPGAKIDDIQFKINGAENVLNNGSIDIHVQFGVLKESIPASWFESKNGNESVEIEFTQNGWNSYGLKFKDENSKINLSEAKLIVDPVPVRQWGTYFSSNTSDSYGRIDNIKYYNQDVFFVGVISGGGMATSGTFQSSFQGYYDGMLVKFSSTGERIWATYCGSATRDQFIDVDIDDQGFIYAVGITGDESGILSTVGAHQSQNNGSFDGIIFKFNPDGTRNWSTYYGGEGYDIFYTISIDSLNSYLYLGGSTSSQQFITTPGAYQESISSSTMNSKGFIAKLNLSGQRVWGSYYSEGYYDQVVDSNIDSQGNFIFGGTSYLHTGGGGFLAKVSPNCQEIWKNFFADDYHSDVYSVDVNIQDEIVIGGWTNSTVSVATAGTFLDSPPAENLNYTGFVIKVNTDGNKIWGTYIGDENYNWVHAVRYSHEGSIFVTGETASLINIASIDGYDTEYEETIKDAFLIKLNSNGQRIWGSYYGGNDYDSGTSIVISPTNEVYLAGETQSFDNISTPNGFQPSLIDFETAVPFLVKFNDCELQTEIIINCDATSLTLTTNDGSMGDWYGPNGYLGNGNSISISNLSNNDLGEYYIEVLNGICSGIISVLINSLGGDAPIPDVENLPTINAVCSITLTPPTATDDCLGTITATTNEPLYYDIPGEYWIIWIYEDNFGNQIYQDQLLILSSGEDFMEEAVPLSVCQDPIVEYNLTLIEPLVTEASSVLFKYYETMQDMTNDNAIADPENYLNPNNLTQIYVKGSVGSGCSDFSIIELSTIPVPIANSLNPIVCDHDDDGISEILLNQYSSQINPNSDVVISFYEDVGMTLMIDPNVNFNVSEGDVIHVKIQTGSCQNQSTITITLGDYTLNSISNFEVCVDDISVPHTFNLNEKSAEIVSVLGVNQNSIKFYDSLLNARAGNLPINANYPNQNNPQTIYASFDNASGCPDIISFDLILYQNPIFEMDDFYQKCIGEPIVINAPAGFNYIWNTGEITQEISIENEGEYSVEISNGNCSINQEITVEDFHPIAFEHTYLNSILNLNIPNNSNLEFSLNGIFWQNSPIFLNMNPGEYDVWIKTQTGCLQQKTIIIYDEIPNFISPNGDGNNDQWDVTFLRNVLDVRIFDRYGKTIFYNQGSQIVPWTGIYLGRELPSGNYWYIINFINGDQLNGSILLKNY